MTEIYKTPEVLHLQERDKDGNLRIVRYYREDIIDSFVARVKRDLGTIQEKADQLEEQTNAGY